jgi:hypothetical protein
MGIKEGKIRKEVHLEQLIISKLEKLAFKEGRTLKNYMEYILIQQSQKTSK